MVAVVIFLYPFYSNSEMYFYLILNIKNGSEMRLFWTRAVRFEASTY